MFVRIKYKAMGGEKGYMTSAQSKEKFLARLKELGIDVDTITELYIREVGKEPTEYDPALLKQ